jgi:two-component system, NarL family, sensor kinase
VVGHGRFIATDALTRYFRRHSAEWAVAGLIVSLLGAVAAMVVLVVVPDLPSMARSGLVMIVATALPYGLVGSVLIARRPDLPFGWLLSGAAVTQVISLATVGPAWAAFQNGHTGRLVMLGLSVGSSLGFVPIAVEGLVNVRFPSGRPATRWGRGLEIVLVAGTALVILGGVFGTSVGNMLPASTPAHARRPLIDVTWVGRVADAMIVFAPIVVLLGLVAGIGVVVRCVRACGVERQQLKWRAAGVVVSLLLFVPAVTDHLSAVVDGLDSTVFVATLAIPVLRYRLWDIDVIIRRSAIYSTVTVILVGFYALITALGAGLASEQVGASVAAAGVALAIVPVRAGSQRVVDRLFYGRRNDPYQALSDIGRRLDAVAAPGEMLPAVVAGVASSLRLPYVAIERPSDGSVLASSGDVPSGTATACERWPLTYQGTPAGFLVALPRRGEDAFDARDQAVLADIARQAGPAVRAEALTADLLDSRQRRVTAREEERRRLRRDLHDGLGPLLTGLGLNLDAARTRLAGVSAGADTVGVEDFLQRAKEASTQAIGDLRTLVYDLRPPALDDLGLVGALRLHTERLSAGAAVRIDIEAQALPELPAAVEVAAFRAAVEAVTNVVRHTDAHLCTVALAASGPELTLTVSDDGRSPANWVPGVGLTAMRELAEELGGTLTAGPSASGGHVSARYPGVPR